MLSVPSCPLFWQAHSNKSQRLGSSKQRIFLFMADYVFGTFILDLWLSGGKMRKGDREREREKGKKKQDRHQPGGSKLFFRWAVRDKKTPPTVTATG